jgi:hypothetical protein
MLDTVYKALMLMVPLLLFATIFVIYELTHQRDYYKDLYCVEVLRDNPNHPVCGEK